VNGCSGSMSGTFLNVHNSIMNMFDAGVVIVIVFAGAVWGLGYRPRAIELLIGASCGFLLARHAIDLRNFLCTI
jgi:hypothetical protein